MIFNKPVTENRFYEVFDELEWYPNFINVNKLQYSGNDKLYEYEYLSLIRTAEEAYSEMPKKLVEYVKNMPEYDEEIFQAITGLEISNG